MWWSCMFLSLIFLPLDLISKESAVVGISWQQFLPYLNKVPSILIFILVPEVHSVSFYILKNKRLGFIWLVWYARTDLASWSHSAIIFFFLKKPVYHLCLLEPNLKEVLNKQHKYLSGPLKILIHFFSVNIFLFLRQFQKITCGLHCVLSFLIPLVDRSGMTLTCF